MLEVNTRFSVGTFRLYCGDFSEAKFWVFYLHALQQVVGIGGFEIGAWRMQLCRARSHGWFLQPHEALATLSVPETARKIAADLFVHFYKGRIDLFQKAAGFAVEQPAVAVSGQGIAQE